METDDCELSAETLMNIKRSLKEIKQGKTVSIGEVKKRCSLK